MKNICLPLFTALLVLTCTTVAQNYHMTVTPENLDRQEFTFDFKSEPVEKELKYRLTVSPKEQDKPLPTNLVVAVVVTKNAQKVFDYGVRPTWQDKKAVFTFSLRQDYVPMARIQVAYSRQDPKADTGIYSVVYYFTLEEFTTPIAQPQAETPPPTDPPKQP